MAIHKHLYRRLHAGAQEASKDWGGGGGGGAPASKALLDNEKAPKNIFPEMLATGEGKFSNHIIFHA
jgi:hypothetical protein